MINTFAATRHIDSNTFSLRRDRFFPTLRRCPECKASMVTNVHGSFRCRLCGYHDRQPMARLRRLAGRTTGTAGGWAMGKIIKAQTRGK